MPYLLFLSRLCGLQINIITFLLWVRLRSNKSNILVVGRSRLDWLFGREGNVKLSPKLSFRRSWSEFLGHFLHLLFITGKKIIISQHEKEREKENSLWDYVKTYHTKKLVQVLLRLDVVKPMKDKGQKEEKGKRENYIFKVAFSDIHQIKE